MQQFTLQEHKDAQVWIRQQDRKKNVKQKDLEIICAVTKENNTWWMFTAPTEQSWWWFQNKREHNNM